MANNKNKFGQYMTPEIMADFMVGLIEHDKNCSCLEPSCGDGSFLIELKKNGFNNITSYEIDKNIINKNFNTTNESFISANIEEKFDIIIGNPPYIRWKNLEENLKKELLTNELWNDFCSYLCDYSSIFILKSIDLLNEGGELIFITSDYWFSTTYAQKIRNYMLQKGYFKEIYHFNETPIFDKVRISFVVFKFIKNKKIKPDIKIVKYFSQKKLEKNDLEKIKNKTHKNMQHFQISQFEKNQKWALVKPNILEQTKKYEKVCLGNNFGDFCDIGNGLVSGLDEAFRLENIALNEKEQKNTINIIKAKDIEQYIFKKITKYIFLKEEINENILKNEYSNFYEQLLNYKDLLLKRYSYGKDLKYWQWAFLRNFKLFASSKERIFVPCKERITNKKRYRFALVPNNCYPTQDVTAIFKKEETKEDLAYIVALLNSKYVFEWLNYNGTKKGDIVEFSHKPLSVIPYRKIDFSNQKEKILHDEIVNLVKKYQKEQNEIYKDKIDICLDELLKL